MISQIKKKGMLGSSDQSKVVRRAQHTGKSGCQAQCSWGQDCPHGRQLGSWRWAGGAALLCADILCEIHCRDLKVSQRLNKWELE